MYLGSIYTVTISDITYDCVDEGNILLTRPAICRATRQSRRVGDDEICLSRPTPITSFETHIALNHGITIGPTMDRDNQFCRIRHAVVSRYRENIVPSLTSNDDFMGPCRERFGAHASFREIEERGFFGDIFPDL